MSFLRCSPERSARSWWLNRRALRHVDVPSATEAGLPNFNVVGWNAIVAPPKTPKEIVAKVNAALTAALTDPGVRKKIEDIGAIPPKAEEASPDWMDSFLRAEVDAWGKVVRAAGVSID